METGVGAENSVSPKEKSTEDDGEAVVVSVPGETEVMIEELKV